MSWPSTRWIDLDRRFQPVERTRGAGGEWEEGFRASGDLLDWSSVLSLPCVVILGEAGSGKTAELRARVKSLEEEGRYAFFIPIEQLQHPGLERSLDIGGRRRLADWRASGAAQAWFMLDAVDEAALRGGSLCAALNLLTDELASSISRVRLILSSRASDWREGDEADLGNLAPYLQTAGTGGPHKPEIVRLAALEPKQVAALAVHHGVDDLPEFLKAVDDASAWALLERPLDAQWIVDYWRERREMGSLWDLIDVSVDRRLGEKETRPNLISRQKARWGASKLALAACLTGRFAFLLPDGSADARSEDALDPREFLADWRGGEIREVLARGLFDQATYGRIRIHHRSVQEFLAAECLDRLSRSAGRAAERDALLFGRGRQVIPRHLTGVVAWLAGTDPNVRRKVLEIGPEHLIDEGDPARLAPEERRLVLEAYAKRFEDRAQVFHMFDRAGLRRFACPGIAESVGAMLRDDGTPLHLTRTLLHLIRAGEVAQLGDAALHVATQQHLPASIRASAVRAAYASGDERVLTALLSIAEDSRAHDRELIAALLDALCPSHLGPRRAAQLLLAAVPANRNTVTSLEPLAEELPRRLTPEQRRDFLSELYSSLRQQLGEGDQPRTAVSLWLAECFAESLALSVEDGIAIEELRGPLDLLLAIHDWSDRFHVEDVGEASRKHSALRRALFWRQAARVALRGRYPRRAWQLGLPTELRPTERDSEWLRQDSLSCSRVEERLIAFDCLCRTTPRLGEDAVDVALREIAEESDRVHGGQALAKRLQRLTNATHQQRDEPWARQRRARELRRAKQIQEQRKALRARVDGIRAGTDLDALVYLYRVCAPHAPGGREVAKFLEAVREKYGSEIASAVREGVVAVWRQHEPASRAEEPPNAVPYASSLGLMGIDAEVEAGLEIARLREPELRRAARYALWELNGFPPWLTCIALRRPGLVAEVFERSLTLDLAAVLEKLELSRILWKLPSASCEVQRSCAHILMASLLATEPLSVSVLTSALKVLRNSDPKMSLDVSALAPARMEAALTESPRVAVWWNHWVRSQPVEAVLWLERTLISVPDATLLVIVVLAQLSRDRPSDRFGDLELNCDALTRLLRIAHAYVRPEDDVTHEGVYSPGARDDAEEARDRLWTKLIQLPGDAPTNALRHMVDDSVFRSRRDWILHQIETHDPDGSLRPMASRDAARFIAAGLREPVSTSDLFAIALARLADLKHHLMHDDFSNRNVYNPKDAPILEVPVQNYLAQELEHRRNGQYAVIREPEITRKRRPDIRLVHPSCDGPVTIEVKIAERYLFRELEAALVSQLVQTYMAANNSRFGVLALCSSGPAHVWRVGDPEAPIDFAEVVRRLQNQALEVERVSLGIRVEVVALDFH